MVTLSAKISDNFNNSLLAFARKHKLGKEELILLALKKLLEAERSAVHVFETEDEIKQFAHTVNARALAKLGM
jgi:hypothetical protein